MIIKEDDDSGLIHLQMVEAEYQLLREALHALLKVKQEALEACREALPHLYFRPSDFAIPTIQHMVADIDNFEEVEP